MCGVNVYLYVCLCVASACLRSLYVYIKQCWRMTKAILSGYKITFVTIGVYKKVFLIYFES